MQKKIIICGLADIQECVDKFSPDKMLTIINKNFEPETPSGMDKNRHLKMLIDDISEPREGFILPEKHHTQELLDFTDDWDKTKPILVHCHMGISRSTATSLGIAAKYSPENIELIIENLKEIAPHASPNKIMMRYYDEILGLDNRLITKKLKNYLKINKFNTLRCANFAQLSSIICNLTLEKKLV